MTAPLRWLLRWVDCRLFGHVYPNAGPHALPECRRHDHHILSWHRDEEAM